MDVDDLIDKARDEAKRFRMVAWTDSADRYDAVLDALVAARALLTGARTLAQAVVDDDGTHEKSGRRDGKYRTWWRCDKCVGEGGTADTVAHDADCPTGLARRLLDALPEGGTS